MKKERFIYGFLLLNEYAESFQQRYQKGKTIAEIFQLADHHLKKMGWTWLETECYLLDSEYKVMDL